MLVNSKSFSFLVSRSSLPLVVCLLIWGVTLIGCGYPEVSPKTYDFAKALYSATNLKQSERLDQLHRLIEEAQGSGEISSREAEYLGDVIELGRAGDWEEAQREIRELLEDQVGTQ